MREPPQPIQPDGIYQSSDLADFWMISKEKRQEWYRVLDANFRDQAAKVGSHYVMKGRTVLASMLQMRCDSEDSQSRK